MNPQKTEASGAAGTRGTTQNTPRSYHNPAANFVERLQKVRRTGPGRWLACCPAHDDKSPSLAIREADDNRVLIHCFGGCSVQEITGALGMELQDLFPPKDGNYKPESRPFPAADILKAIAFEATVAGLAIGHFLDGKPFGQPERDRLMLAVSRIQNGLTAGGVR
ncbi:CHC2 zinc finger domain-containing protein [Ferrovum myxofaciens]|uniref:CHC2 zinc finger domain-containing protein n=1 Tax=Ferrovum myxofaciens TaxID=416213 RepID=UPI0023533F82|nr:CHC2 zinc finger domain-containing protein [Ferrovum myxofaciens]MBU6995602.1 hypothetical protein [Ferrovum myxofaciens]